MLFLRQTTQVVHTTIRSAWGLMALAALMWCPFTASVAQAATTPTSIDITPLSTTVAPNGVVSYTGVVRDELNNPMSPQPLVMWSASGGGTFADASCRKKG